MFSGFRPLQVYKHGVDIPTVFENYEINVCAVVRHKKNGPIGITISGNYNRISVYNEGKKVSIRLSRAVLSTFAGPPPTSKHTADHRISDRKLDDRLINLRWATDKQQRSNQIKYNKYKENIVVHNGIEKSVSDWASFLNIGRNAVRLRVKRDSDWNYKEYENMNNEIWKSVLETKSNPISFEVSNFGRLAKITKYGRTIIDPKHMKLNGGKYPCIQINRKKVSLHLVVFKTFFPNEYDMKKEEEVICHKNDNVYDCSIDNLVIGSLSKNAMDAHLNGKFDGKKSQMQCIIAEHKETGIMYDFASIREAIRWLKENTDWKKACRKSIYTCLRNNTRSAYGYKWAYGGSQSQPARY